MVMPTNNTTSPSPTAATSLSVDTTNVHHITVCWCHPHLPCHCLSTPPTSTVVESAAITCHQVCYALPVFVVSCFFFALACAISHWALCVSKLGQLHHHQIPLIHTVIRLFFYQLYYYILKWKWVGFGVLWKVANSTQDICSIYDVPFIGQWIIIELLLYLEINQWSKRK